FQDIHNDHIRRLLPHLTTNRFTLGTPRQDRRRRPRCLRSAPWPCVPRSSSCLLRGSPILHPRFLHRPHHRRIQRHPRQDLGGRTPPVLLVYGPQRHIPTRSKEERPHQQQRQVQARQKQGQMHVVRQDRSLGRRLYGEEKRTVQRRCKG